MKKKAEEILSAFDRILETEATPEEKKRLIKSGCALGLQKWRRARRLNSRTGVDAIDCEFFKKNLDGSWTGGPDAKIGEIMMGELTFVRFGFKVGGADLVSALEQKCGRKF